MVIESAALRAWIEAHAGAKTPVVAVVSKFRPDTISRTDVSTVSIAGGVAAIAAANLSSVMG